MIWRHLVISSSDGQRSNSGAKLTYAGRNDRSAGVFVDNETPTKTRQKGAPQQAAGPLPSTWANSPGTGAFSEGASAACLGRVPQSVRRSPVDVENTWVSPGRGTTCSVAPFSGTARPLTRT